MDVDDKNEYANCPYCNLKYKLKKDTNLNIKLELDDNMKKSLKTGGKIGVVAIVIYCIIILAIIGIAIFSITKVFIPIFNSFEQNNVAEEKDSFFDEDISDIEDDFDVDEFNNSYEIYSGTQSKFFVTRLLEKVVTNNKKNEDKKIAVIYNETKTDVPDQITELKQQLPDKEYEVVLDYNEKGYVYQVTLQD